MRLHRIVLATVALTLALAPLSARAAGAPPEYVTSSPAEGEKLASAPAEVWIAFTMPLDPSSKMRVVDECDRRVDDGNIEVTGNRISIGIDKEPSGHYIVTWVARAPSGATGDGAGTYHFEVTGGTSCGGGGGHEGHGGGKEGGNHKGHGGGGCGCDKKHEGHGSNGGDHSGSGHSDSGHSGSGHSSSGTHTANHSSMSGDHGNSGDHSMNGHGEHGKGKSGKGKHAGHEEEPEVLSKELAAPGVPELPSVAGSDVLLALLICMVLGAAGGYVVRSSFNI